MARLYVAELGIRDSSVTQTAPFNTIAEARAWAQGHGRAADWCVIRYAGRVVARHERETTGDGLGWFRVLPERRAATPNPQRKFFIFGPRNNHGALRLIGVVLARGESAAEVRRRLIEREGYPGDITVKRLDRKRKGQVLESAGPEPRR